MLVKFIEVGRNKLTWTESTKEASRNWMLSQVRSKLMSREIEFIEGDIVVGGFRTVGKYEIVSDRF